MGSWQRVVVCEICETCFADEEAARDHFVDRHVRHDQYRGGCKGHKRLRGTGSSLYASSHD